MQNILITGAASGIGLALLARYSRSDRNTTIFAVDRKPIPKVEDGLAGPLAAKIVSIQLDVTRSDFPDILQQHLHGVPIDTVLHSIGIRGLVPEMEKKVGTNIAKAEDLESVDLETLLRTFHINAAATFQLLQSLVPNLRKAREARGEQSKVIVMSSRMGSMANNTSGGAYAYRASKAALNSIAKSFAIDTRGEIITALVHPGRVDTGLVEFFEPMSIDTEECVKSLVSLVEHQIGPEQSGKFLDRFGHEIQW